MFFAPALGCEIGNKVVGVYRENTFCILQVGFGLPGPRAGAYVLHAYAQAYSATSQLRSRHVLLLTRLLRRSVALAGATRFSHCTLFGIARGDDVSVRIVVTWVDARPVIASTLCVAGRYKQLC